LVLIDVVPSRHKRQRNGGAGKKNDEWGWYYVDNAGEEQGPFDRDAMQAWYKAGQLLPATKVRKGKEGNFRLAKTSTAVTGMNRDELRKTEKENSVPFEERRKNRVYVGNLPSTTTREQVEELFSQCGATTDVWVPEGSEKGKNRGFAFVSFKSAETMEAAIEKMSDHVFSGRKLRVNAAKGSNGNRQNRGLAGLQESAAGPCAQVDGGANSSEAIKGMYGGDATKKGSWVECFDSGTNRP